MKGRTALITGAAGGLGTHIAETILEIGGSLDFMEQYIKFRGNKPKLDGLLKVSGISV